MDIENNENTKKSNASRGINYINDGRFVILKN